MTELFLHFLNGGIAAGWLVLFVLAARFLLKKAPKWVAPALWGIVALRLLLPFSVESALSLIPSAETVSPEVVHFDPRPTITSGVEAIDNAVNPVLSESFAVEDATVSVNPLDVWTGVAGAVWLLGVALMLGYVLFSWARLHRRVRTAVRLEEGVYQSENAPSPFILGVLRPRIYVPFTLEGTALKCVLAHEQAHLARRDHWWKPLGYVLLALYWFQPLLWVAYLLLCRDIELACDERVIRAATPAQRADYSQALLACSTGKRTRIAACPLAFGEVGVKARVKRVLSYKKPAFYFVLAAVAVGVVLAVCGLTDPKTEDDTTPYRWTSSVSVQAVDRAVLSTGEELSESQLAALVKALNAVEKDELSDSGRGVPYTARVTLTCGEAEYTLGAGGEITELHMDAITAAQYDAPMGPAWEVHNATLATLIVSFSSATATLPDEPDGDVPNTEEIPTAVEQAAQEQARQWYEWFRTEGDFAVTDYRVSAIYHEASFRPEGVPISIYSFWIELLAAESESVTIAGGRVANGEGWVSHVRFDQPCYLIYTTENGALRLLGTEIDDGGFIEQVGYGGLIGLLHENGLGSQQSAKFLFANDLNADGQPEYLYREGQTLRVLDIGGDVLWSAEVGEGEVYFLDRYENRFLYYAAGKDGARCRLFDLRSGEENLLAQGSMALSATADERKEFAEAVNALLSQGGCELVGGALSEQVYVDSSTGVFRAAVLGETSLTGNSAFDALILALERSRAEAANGGTFDTERFSGALNPGYDSFQTPGWLVYDIDGDGQNELLFGENDDDGWDSIVFHIYAGDGTPVAYGWERSRYMLCGNGVVMHEGASGAGEYSTTIYRYQNGALVPEKTVYHLNGTNYYGEGLSADAFYAQQSDGTYAVSSAFTPVSEARAEEIIGSYRKLNLTFTPFG